MFSDALGLLSQAYLDFLRSKEWEAAVTRYRMLFTAFDIRPQDVLLRLPNRRLCIRPHIQEYLVGLDSEWEGHLTRWALVVQNALRTDAALPPFLVAGAAPPEGEAPALDSDLRVRGQKDPGDAAGRATENPQIDGGRDATPLGSSQVPLMPQRRFSNTWSDRLYVYWRGRRGAGYKRCGRPRGSARGSRANIAERGAAPSQERIPRAGGSKPPPAPGQRRDNGGEVEPSREGIGSERRGTASGSAGQLRTPMGDKQEGATCGGCQAIVGQGQRMVGIPCGHRHVMHARCVINVVMRSGAQAPLLCSARDCTARHGRQEALEAAVQANPVLRATAVGLGGIPGDGEDGRLHGLCYPWYQDTLGIAGPLDVPLEDLEQRFTTVVKVQPRLVTAHAKRFTHVLGLLNHALGENRQNRLSQTPNSLMRPLKLWYILSTLLHSWDGRVKRH